MKIKTLAFFLMIGAMVAFSQSSPARILFNPLPEGVFFHPKVTAVSSQQGDQVPTVKVRQGNTAQGLLDRDLVDQEGASVARVNDLIINKKGKAELLVISGNSMIGITGKLVALDFKAVAKSSPATGLLVFEPVSRLSLEQAAPFSPVAPAETEAKKVVSAGGMSINQILKGKIIDEEGKVLADINNVTFDGAQAEYVVVSVNELLDMGEQRAVLDFSNLTFLPDQNGKVINARLNAPQVSGFKSFLEGLKGQG